MPTPKRTKLEANVIARKTNTHFAWFRIREKKSVSSTLTFAFLAAAAPFGAPERVARAGRCDGQLGPLRVSLLIRGESTGPAARPT